VTPITFLPRGIAVGWRGTGFGFWFLAEKERREREMVGKERKREFSF